MFVERAALHLHYLFLWKCQRWRWPFETAKPTCHCGLLCMRIMETPLYDERWNLAAGHGGGISVAPHRKASWLKNHSAKWKSGYPQMIQPVSMKPFSLCLAHKKSRKNCGCYRKSGPIDWRHRSARAKLPYSGCLFSLPYWEPIWTGHADENLSPVHHSTRWFSNHYSF